MSIITLLTDFGTQNEYAGVMKGVILSTNPSATIVDITHHIPPQNLRQTALTLKTAYPYFPKDTIHVTVVDPGVGSDRRIVAVKTASAIFLAPDNGVLSFILAAEEIISVVSVENKSYFRSAISQTFHGRDIFAPVAGHLASGLELKNLGPAMTEDQLVRLTFPEPQTGSGEINGEIVSIDRFGNLITNIERGLIEQQFKPWNKKDIIVHISGMTIHGIANAYTDADSGCLLSIFGSSECLEIAVNGGDASRMLAARQGDPIRLSKGKKLAE